MHSCAAIHFNFHMSPSPWWRWSSASDCARNPIHHVVLSWLRPTEKFSMDPFVVRLLTHGDPDSCTCIFSSMPHRWKVCRSLVIWRSWKLGSWVPTFFKIRLDFPAPSLHIEKNRDKSLIGKKKAKSQIHSINWAALKHSSNKAPYSPMTWQGEIRELH